MTESKVTAAYSEEKGRCLVANQDVFEGEILCVSKPYALVPSVTKKNYVCANCIHIFNEQTQVTKMIICRQNCLHVFYCSNQCEGQHWEKFHQYECSFLDKVCSLKGYQSNEYVINYAQLVMRMLTQRLNDVLNKPHDVLFEHVWAMRSHYDDFTMEKKNEFGIVAKTLTEYILTILIPHLIKNNQEFIRIIQSFLPDSQDATKVEISNVDLWLTDMTHSCSIPNNAASIEALKYLLNKVYILICMEEINSFFDTTFMFDGYSQQSQNYALGVYPFAALINHACSPNTAHFLKKENRSNLRIGDHVLFATQAIKKGDELSLSYVEWKYDLYRKDQVDAYEIIQNQAQRKQTLKDVYFFDCQCACCSNESKGKLDESYITLVRRFKCTMPTCRGWFIPTYEKHLCCEACGMKR